MITLVQDDIFLVMWNRNSNKAFLIPNHRQWVLLRNYGDQCTEVWRLELLTTNRYAVLDWQELTVNFLRLCSDLVHAHGSRVRFWLGTNVNPGGGGGVPPLKNHGDDWMEAKLRTQKNPLAFWHYPKNPWTKITLQKIPCQITPKLPGEAII